MNSKYNDSFKLLKNHARLLGLSPVEIELFNNMNTPVSVLGVSKKIGVSRTTLYPHIEKLEKRGFLKVIQVQKKKLYIACSKSDMANSLIQLGIDISNTSTIKMANIDTKIQMFVGKRQLSKAWLLIGNQPVGSKVITVQPNNSLKH